MNTRVPNGWGDPSTERHLQVPPRHATPDRAAKIERLAAALYKAETGNMWPPSRPVMQENYRKAVRAVLAALEDEPDE